jgi:sterol desaturase/sphingolipid hydroxylase (fatty acid hydroxylase superfamily)
VRPRLEHRHQPLLSRREFYARIARYFGATIAIVTVGLVIGVCGYHYLESLAWIDAFVNAAMILGGMGPVDPLKTTAGKLFAGVYALLCGFVLLVAAAVLMTPLLHRTLHRFHLERDRRG